MTAPLRTVLVVEFLHCSAGVWAQASESMRAEAAAMLAALATDIGLLKGWQALVPVCEGVPVPPRLSGTFRTITVRALDDVAQVLAHGAESVREPSQVELLHVTDVIVIAPECRMILANVLQRFRRCVGSRCRIVNPDDALTAVFSDKLKTEAWLAGQATAVPGSLPVSDTLAQRWLGDTLIGASAHDLSQPEFVLKPRDGVGSDRVMLLRSDHAAIREIQQYAIRERFSNKSGADWILQPFVAGLSCSVGLIGGDGIRPPFVLPPALQTLRESRHQLAYHGGEIPLRGSAGAAMTCLGERLADALGPFRGYIGIDAIVPATGADPVVLDVNPRLCTSYVGYRAIPGLNPAALLFCDDPIRDADPGALHGLHELSEHGVHVRFELDGTIAQS